MAFSETDKKEIERIFKKEIKDFFESSTLNQYEQKLIDKIQKEIKSGKIRKDVNEIISKAFTEFYYVLWSKKSQWESSIKNLS